MERIAGNINKERTTFTWIDHGTRRTHRLGSHDIFVTSSISGEELVMQQRGKPLQFMVLDGAHLRRYLTRTQGTTVYVSPDVLERYQDALESIEHVRIVHPTRTRHAKRRRDDDDPSSSQHRTDDPPPASSSSDEPQNIHELDSDDEEPPLGLYAYIGKQSFNLRQLVCHDAKRQAYLHQHPDVRKHCTSTQFQSLSQPLHCHEGMPFRKCARDLLKYLHPDKADSEHKACAEAMYKEVNFALHELGDQPGFASETATCA